MDGKKYKKAVAAAVIGNILEWYDFVLYAFFAVYISKNFFSSVSDLDGIIKTFTVFAAAFLAKPLGAFAIGAYADKYGRKNALSLTIILMAVGIAIMAFSPGADTICIFAPLALLAARLIQGFSAGGEIGAATAFLVEYAPKNKQAFFASLFPSCMGIAAVLGAMSGVFITSVFTEEEIFAFAWRLPFIFGLAILPVGLYIRRSIDETPEFKQSLEARKTPGAPLREIFAKHKRPLALAVAFSLLWTATPYVYVMYMPTFFMKLGFDKNHVFWASALANFCMMVASPLVGALADRYGIKRLLYVSIAAMALGNFFFMWLLKGGTDLWLVLLVHSGLLLFGSFFIGNAPVAVSKSFPLEVRSSGVSISYNVASLLMGFTPAFLSWAFAYFYAPQILIAAVALVSVTAVYFMKIE